MKGFFTLVMIFAIVYSIYSGFMAVWSYFELTTLVEEVVPREIPKISERGWRSADRSGRIRAAIVQGATEAGVALDPDAVMVSEEDGALWVRINAGYPMIRYHGEVWLSIPISTAHSFPLGR